MSTTRDQSSNRYEQEHTSSVIVQDLTSQTHDEASLLFAGTQFDHNEVGPATSDLLHAHGSNTGTRGAQQSDILLLILIILSAPTTEEFDFGTRGGLQ